MQPQTLLNLQEHLTLSARMNYLLAAREPQHGEILSHVLGNAEVFGSNDAVEAGIGFLGFAYQNRNRKLGPLAMLHPLRTAHLLSLATEQPSDLDLLTAFLHDYYEDIYTSECKDDMQRELEARMHTIGQHFSPEQRDQLEYRLQTLTKQNSEQYHEYLGRLMDESRYCTEIIWVKLADRLDNTFDMRVVEDNSTEDFFRELFDILFLRHEVKSHLRPKRPKGAPIDEAHRLFQMFKNVVFLSLVRRSELDQVNLPAQRLFHALTDASIHETGRILMHIFSHDIVDVKKQRQLIFEVIDYSQDGGLNRITPARRGHRLDGLFQERFDHAERSRREAALRELQQDKELMTVSALAFLGVFESFFSSSSFRLGGVRETGLTDEDTLA